MADIEGMLRAAQEELEDNAIGAAIVKIIKEYPNSWNDFVYFLFDSWYKGVIDNPVKSINRDDLPVYPSEQHLKKLFKINKEDFEDQCQDILKYNWTLPTKNSFIVSSRNEVAVAFQAYFLHFPVYYCGKETEYGDRPGFLILDKGLTFDNWLEDISPFEEVVDYPIDKASWKLVD